MPNFELETQAIQQGHLIVAGVDEAGRGPWAGPVVAGAAILNADQISFELRTGLDDSKKLKASRREALFDVLKVEATIGIGIASVEEIDQINILQATFLAMSRAVADLRVKPDFALIDGNRPPKLDCPLDCIVKGDAISLSIAAASIVAKVSRDQMMSELALKYPGYGWERNQGYGTPQHKAAMERLGITPAHRKSYAPVLRIINQE